MRCSFCPKDVEMAQWQQFVLHFRNMHTPQENEKYEQANHDDDLDLAEKSAAEEAQEINLATRDEHINLELEIETVQSLLSEAEESGGSDQEDELEPGQEQESSDQPADDVNVLSTPIYKVHIHPTSKSTLTHTYYFFSSNRPSFAETHEHQSSLRSTRHIHASGTRVTGNTKSAVLARKPLNR